MKYVSLVTLCIAVSSSASAAQRNIDFSPTDGQKVRYRNGVELIDSELPKSVVRIVEPTEAFDKRAELEVIIVHRFARPVNFGPDSIAATDADGQSLQVVAYDSLAKEERGRRRWRKFGAAVLAMSNNISAANAGDESGSLSYSGTSHGSVAGYGYTAYNSGTATYSGYNATAAAIATQTAQRRNEQIADRLANKNASAESGLTRFLQISTVDPQKPYGGYIVLQMPKPGKSAETDRTVEFKVTVGDELHTIKAVLKP